MNKIKILLLGLMILTVFSCEKNDDAVYISHKFSLTAERNTEYEYYINFSWNEAPIANVEEYLLVKTFEEQDRSFFQDIADYFINMEEYNEYPYWIDSCYIYSSYDNATYRELYDYDIEEKSFYTAIAYNNEGQFLISNTVEI